MADPETLDAGPSKTPWTIQMVSKVLDKFWDVSAEERQQLLGQVVHSLTGSVQTLPSEERREMVRILVDKAIEGLIADISPEERGDLIASAVVHVFKELQRNVAGWTRLAIEAAFEGAFVLKDKLGGILRDPGFLRMLKEATVAIIRAFSSLVLETLKTVWGQVKETTPEIVQFLRDLVISGLRLVSELLAGFVQRLLAAIAALMGLAAEAIAGGKDLVGKLWASDAASDLRSVVSTTVEHHLVAVRAAVKSGTTKVDDLAKKTGLPAATVRRALANLWESGEIGLELVKSSLPETGKGPGASGKGTPPGPAPG